MIGVFKGGGLHPYHIFMIGVVKGVEASSLFYIQNRHSQGGGGLYPYHKFIIGVVRGGGGA